MTMKPALTAEEWARVPINKEGICDYLDIMYGAFAGSEDVFPEPGGSSAQAMAALALYGQQFGFTREDVKGLNLYLWEIERVARTLAAQDPETFGGDALAGWPSAIPGGLLGQIEWLRGFIARIEALLPPEG